ncbi:hypothetical protein [Fluviicola sp.]|uniref:hypothetical protein n=1 Tax=Fluviicola sp. TaxID=1917219 RepID=UPI0031DC12FC
MEVMDVGFFGKQRLLMRASKGGSLAHHHIFKGTAYFYTFPDFLVAKGDYVVLYINRGERQTKVFYKDTCHFFFFGKWMSFWEAVPDKISIVYDEKLLKNLSLDKR